MIPTRAPCPRHLAIPGIAYPQGIPVCGAEPDERNYQDWSRPLGVSTGRPIEPVHTTQNQLFDRLSQLWGRW
jgi:hypothetical protein